MFLSVLCLINKTVQFYKGGKIPSSQSEQGTLIRAYIRATVMKTVCLRNGERMKYSHAKMSYDCFST